MHRSARWPRWPAILLLASSPLLAQGGIGTLEEGIAATEQQIADLSAALADQPEAAELWQQWIMLRSHHWSLVRQLQGTPADDAAARAQLRALYEEWIQAQPDSAAAHLGLTAALVPDETTPYLLALAERFPADAEVQGRAADAARSAGDYERAAELVERFLASHREAPGAHSTAFAHYQRAGDGVRAGLILEDWLALHPGDPSALSLLIDRSWNKPGGLEEIVPILRAGIDTIEPLPAARPLCSRLGYLPEPALAELSLDCYGKLLAADLPSDEETALLSELAQALDRAGQGGLSGDLLSTLAEDDQARVLIRMASERARDGRCDEAVDLAEAAPVLTFPVGAYLRGVFVGCAGDPALERRLVAVAQRLEPDEWGNLLLQWPERRPLGGLETLVLGHLRRHPDDNQVWNTLEGIYERTGERSKREALLRRWIEVASLEGVGGRAFEKLSELFASDGRWAEAIALHENLTAAGSFGDQPHYLEQMANLYLTAGDPGRAAEVASRMLAHDDAENRGQLVLARIAVARQDWEGALATYRSLLEEHPHPAPEALHEFAALAAELGHEDELFAVLEAAYARLASETGPIGVREDWVAQQLEELSLARPALEYLEVAARRSPARADLQLRIGDAAESLGQWERAEAAWRRLLELDPENANHWYRLAALELARGQPARTQQVVEEATAALGYRPPNLTLPLAESLLAQEQPLEAARALREHLAEHPNDWRADELLRRSYERLARQAAAASTADDREP